MVSINSDQDTIAAIATAIAPSQGGIAVIRISGPQAEDVGKAIVQVPGSQEWGSHRVIYGHVMDVEGRQCLDEVLILLMKAPRSFTAEDVVEIHCHGGLMAVQQVLERVLDQPGVRRALPGEFSQRAVLNGRLDLTRAEAISDLVAARSRRAAELAMVGLDGGIQQHVNALRQRLLDQLSELEARVDFEEDLPPLDASALLSELQAVHTALDQLVEDGKRGSLLRRGLRVALVGCPNVGKSSLLNRLSRRERAIVNELPGTTRDLLESDIILDGVPITLLDTAGIRTTGNAVEQQGIARSFEALASADVVLLLFDLVRGWTSEEAALLKMIPESVPYLLVGNKVDLHGSEASVKGETTTMVDDPPVELKISAQTGEGEAALVDAVLQCCGVLSEQPLLLSLNQRQSDLAVAAAAALQRSEHVAEEGLPWDFWTIDLRQAIHHLGEITGEELTETVLDRIFSRFCIGK